MGESLSLASDQESVVGITNPEGNRVFFWDFKENKIVKELKVEKPHGIWYFEKQKKFFVSSGRERNLLEISLLRSQLEDFSVIKTKWGNGSHLYAYKI